MGTFIDRDPQKMIRYGQDATNVLKEMAAIIRNVEAILDNSAKDLDDVSQKQIAALHTCCSKYFDQMRVYEDVADKITKAGKKLLAIRTEGGV